MPGSLSNYNWSKFSDADVHIIVDLNQFDKEDIHLYQELFKNKFTPNRYFMTDSGRQSRKINFPLVTLDQFLSGWKDPRF
jgi:hypothetical protein